MIAARGNGSAIADELSNSCDIISSMIALNAHFDGKVLIPDEPLALPANQKVRIELEPIGPGPTKPPGKRTFVTQPGSIVYVATDFDAHLGDDFWGIGDDK